MASDTVGVLAEIDSIVASDKTFWNELGRKHRDMIARYGFENFKRTINFEYGQWGVSTFHHRFTRNLVRELLKSGTLPRPGRVAGKIGPVRWPDVLDGDTGTAAAEGRDGGPWKMRAYAAYCGLLWQYAAQRDTLGVLSLTEPSLGNPLPVMWNGRMISQDLAIASMVINTIMRFSKPRNDWNVLEIGAGYGALSYAFRSNFPDSKYTIVDIPPAITVSRNYLGETLPGGRFLRPRDLSDVPANTFNLAINVSSFDEMPPDVAQDYVAQIDRTTRGMIYFSGFARTSHLGNRRGLDELHYPQGWNVFYDAPHPIFSGFVEKVFSN